MTTIDLGDIAITSDKYNWTVRRWTPLGDDAKDTRDTLTRDGVRGRWRDVSFHGSLSAALTWAHDELVKRANARTLEALTCAVQDAAGAIVAAVAAAGVRRAA